jgi:hypothetical protein
MPSVNRALARLLLVLATALAGVVLLPAAQASAVVSHRALNDTRPVSAAPVHVDFPVEYFGLVATLAPGRDHLQHRPAGYGQVRFEVQGRWTPWQALDQDGAQAPGQFTSALVSVDRATAYQVRGLSAGATSWQAAAINTTDGPTVEVGRRPADAAAAAAPCRSRADWGADESISGWSKGTETPAFYPVQTLTVHHTAGSNDPTQDYAATVRAIYSYHVQTNGWSDIGYQYLIDGNGVVYEGRSTGQTSKSCVYGGGDGSDFAHETGTDNVVNGAHVTGFNAGNVGVALMGCFEATTECSGSTTVPPAAVDGLETLLASLATRHGLDPQGQAHYVNPVSAATKDIAVVSGHRDWAATACPGGNLYAQLPAIRTEVARRMSGAPAPAVPPAAPESLTASASAGTVSVAWTAPADDGGSPVSRYELFRSTSNPVPTSGTPRYSGTSLSWSESPVTGSYYYAVRACNATGCGPLRTAGPVTVKVVARITGVTCTGPACSFTGRGTGVLHWVFGNGSKATGSTVSTKYTSVGSYTVRLTDSQVPATQDSRVVSCSRVNRKLQCSG